MFGTRCCLMILVIAALAAAPAGAVSVQPGWDVIAPVEIVFVGDAVNITAIGPAVNLTVEFRLSDPNGDLFRFYYSQVLNGSASWNFSTADAWFPQNGSGVWRVSAYINGEQVAFGEFSVLFDELTYLSRRQALLEERQAQLEGIDANLLADNKDLHSRIDLVLIFVPCWIIMGSMVFYWCIRKAGWPLYQFLRELRKQYGPGVKYSMITQFMDWLAAPYGAAEMEQFHMEMRQQVDPNWPAAEMAARCRLEGEQLGVPLALRPVKKIRVVVNKEASP